VFFFFWVLPFLFSQFVLGFFVSYRSNCTLPPFSHLLFSRVFRERRPFFVLFLNLSWPSRCGPHRAFFFFSQGFYPQVLLDRESLPSPPSRLKKMLFPHFPPRLLFRLSLSFRGVKVDDFFVFFFFFFFFFLFCFVFFCFLCGVFVFVFLFFSFFLLWVNTHFLLSPDEVPKNPFFRSFRTSPPYGSRICMVNSLAILLPSPPSSDGSDEVALLVFPSPL